MKKILMLLVISCAIFNAKSQSQDYGPLLFSNYIQKDISYTASNGDIFTFSFYSTTTGTMMSVCSVGNPDNWYEADFTFYSTQYPAGFRPDVYLGTTFGNSYIFNGNTDFYIGDYVESGMEYDSDDDFTANIIIYSAGGVSIICEFYIDLVKIQNSITSATWGVY